MNRAYKAQPVTTTIALTTEVPAGTGTPVWALVASLLDRQQFTVSTDKQPSVRQLLPD
ncbi:hypothetical protein HK413_07030 [Mucilaginibacter sp. S1162]|uniref:Uncharacterized protein n=1 Tax=Mucilaginibacter humi TaxID=2732510 RepID=A0ABX1W6W8_9SPHI|nr:hypothetical protein [Mucilaginibacter humi]NNU33967.1 hypothetical protein [Mucilaginibacter humi]